jgi:hypothetical protein
MRRFVTVGAGTLLLLASFATPAAAAGPVHGTGGFTFDYTFGAGVMCPFDLHWVQDGSRQQALTFPVQSNGDQLTRFAGLEWSTVTNVDTGATMVVGGGLRMDFIAHRDGTFEYFVDGTVVAGYVTTDAPGAGLWLFHGRLHDTIASDGFSTTSHSFEGGATDLCAALGG